MLTKEQVRRMETIGMNFLRTVSGYRMTDQKRSEDIREEMGMADRAYQDNSKQRIPSRTQSLRPH
jgi:hypothetical protein